jgi:hypothetical protein
VLKIYANTPNYDGDAARNFLDSIGEDIWMITMEESPYGDTGAVYEGALGMMNHWVLQLETFKTQPSQTKEGLEAIDADITGYKEILASGSQENANKFLEIKTNGKRGVGLEYKDNLAIVNHMKENNLWKSMTP